MVKLLQEAMTYQRNLLETSWKTQSLGRGMGNRNGTQKGQANLAHFVDNAALNSPINGDFNKNKIERR